MRKYLMVFFCLCLNGCAVAPTYEQAMTMQPLELCLANNFPAQSLAITERKINCNKVIASATKAAAPRMSMNELCSVWAARSLPAAMPAIDAEVKKRRVDCVAVEGNRQAMMAAQQAQAQAALQQQQMINQMNYQNQMQMIYNSQANRRNNINCTTSYYSYGANTHCY